MASNVHCTILRRNACVDAFGDNLDAGTIKIYDGTQAANADTAIGAQVLLATLTFNAAAFPAAASGSAAAAAITSGTAAATGTATWARIATSGGTTLLDCSVGTASTDIVLNSAAISSGATVAISALTLSMAA